MQKIPWHYFSRKVINVSLHFEAVWCEFWCMCSMNPWANRRNQNMSCFYGNLVPILTPKSSMPQNITSTETWQLSLPTTASFNAQVGRHPKPTTQQNMSSFSGQPSRSFKGTLNLETYRPLKHVKFQILCFGAMHPAPCKTHPCPIHSALHIFWLLHCCHLFFPWTSICHFHLHHCSLIIDINLGFW